MTNSAPYCARSFASVGFEDYGHWLPLEAPRELAHEIIRFAQVVT
jgi:pimeloyl-ACP methyl ester carboxylesterase